MRYHHLGVPTTERRPGERYLPHLKMFVSGYDASPYRIEWMRFEAGCTFPELVQTVPHVAFEVDDIGEAIAGKEILIAPNSPAPGITVDNDAPVEFLHIDRSVADEV